MARAVDRGFHAVGVLLPRNTEDHHQQGHRRRQCGVLVVRLRGYADSISAPTQLRLPRVGYHQRRHEVCHQCISRRARRAYVAAFSLYLVQPRPALPPAAFQESERRRDHPHGYRGDRAVGGIHRRFDCLAGDAGGVVDSPIFLSSSCRISGWASPPSRCIRRRFISSPDCSTRSIS